VLVWEESTLTMEIVDALSEQESFLT